MTEPIPKRCYTAGDEIRLRVTIVHEQNLKEVQAIFRRDSSPRTTITFIGDVEETEELGPPKYPLRPGPYLRRRSSVVLVSLVDVDHMPGLYELSKLVLQTAADDQIVLQVGEYELVKAQDAVFRIVNESSTIEEAVVEFEDPDEQ